MSTLTNKIEFNVLATDVSIDENQLTVSLADGRIISIPLAYFPKLLHATPEQRNNWRLIGHGQGITWEVIDEDLSVEGLLRVH